MDCIKIAGCVMAGLGGSWLAYNIGVKLGEMYPSTKTYQSLNETQKEILCVSAYIAAGTNGYITSKTLLGIVKILDPGFHLLTYGFNPDQFPTLAALGARHVKCSTPFYFSVLTLIGIASTYCKGSDPESPPNVQPKAVL